MKNQRRKFTAEFKVQILREHIENQVPVGKLCEQHGIQTTLFYNWKNELFTGALDIFSKNKNGKSKTDKLHQLEEKLRDKDSLISEIVEDNLRLKKSVS